MFRNNESDNQENTDLAPQLSLHELSEELSYSSNIGPGEILAPF